MPFPTTAFGIATLIVLLLPGLVFGLVRRKLRGFQYDDLTFDARVAQAVVVSVLLDSVYLIVASQWLGTLVRFVDGEVWIQRPFGLAITLLVGAFVVPAGLAALIWSPYRIRRITKSQDHRFPLKLERTVYYDSVPTAWDVGATSPAHRMVRVRMDDGTWAGVFFGPGSYVSTYPEPRDIYISHQYHMKPDGSFGGAVEGGAGMWLRVGDNNVVEFLEPSYTKEQKEANESGG